MAEFLGATRGRVQAWAAGQRPAADDLQRIAEKLGLSPRWLLTGQGEPEDTTPTARERETLYHGDPKRLAEMLAKGEAANIVVEPDTLTAKIFFLESEYMDQGVTRLDILHMIKTWIDAQVRAAEDARTMERDRQDAARAIGQARADQGKPGREAPPTPPEKTDRP